MNFIQSTRQKINKVLYKLHFNKTKNQGLKDLYMFMLYYKSINKENI